MKALKISAIIVACSAVVSSSAQQSYQHSQYQTNPYLVNPAASGIYEYIDITAGYRQQWSGFTNAPTTFFVSGHGKLGSGSRPLYNPSLRIGSRGPVKTPEIATGKMKHVVGGYAFGDEYGAFQNYTFMASYAIHLPVMRGYNLSFGVAAGYALHQFDQNKVQMLDPNDNTYSNFLGTGPNQGYINANAGLWFYSDKLFAGYSSAQLLKTLVSVGSPYTDFDLSMHHFITAGYRFDLTQELSLTPSVLAKFMSPAPLALDFTVLATYDKWIWGGISYRNQDAIIGLFGLNINELFKLGYSYDFTVSKLGPFNNGSHEITLGVTLGK